MGINRRLDFRAVFSNGYFPGTGKEFVKFVESIGFESVLKNNFLRSYEQLPSEYEIKSWANSLRAVGEIFYYENFDDTGVVVEFKLPYTSRRIDLMVFGENEEGKNSVLVELKQWERAWKTDIMDVVKLFDGRYDLHPSAQACGYSEYLKDNHTAFYSDYSDDSSDYLKIYPCSYLHNARSTTCGDLLDDFYQHALRKAPLFTFDKSGDFASFIRERVFLGRGYECLEKLAEGRYLPSKKLLEHAAEMIRGNPAFELLDEQKVAFNIVFSRVKEARENERKTVVIVKGGPGTGKSVIAVQLLAELAKLGYKVVHCTGSKSFTTNLRAKVGRKAAALFKYFNSFVNAEPNSFDVIIADEAHRLRETSYNRFARIPKELYRPQVEEIIDASRVSVFLLDENQIVSLVKLERLN